MDLRIKDRKIIQKVKEEQVSLNNKYDMHRYKVKGKNHRSCLDPEGSLQVNTLHSRVGWPHLFFAEEKLLTCGRQSW